MSATSSAVVSRRVVKEDAFSLRAEAGLSHSPHSRPEEKRMVFSMWIHERYRREFILALQPYLATLTGKFYGEKFLEIGRCLIRLPVETLEGVEVPLELHLRELQTIIDRHIAQFPATTKPARVQAPIPAWKRGKLDRARRGQHATPARTSR